ncbi:MAG TPA: hypothetical protein PK863_02670 [Candidatus Dojkabacteria bacterium]|nr:hypothetical protein [Candidatus Dojkabacteria bacterium]HRP36711.1 hypothetical protein [Candidatus Dojkabacteria bacterium]HRP51464.1 hypothetical protein [Candidatus Dojkabacteria bacterium]
MQDNFNNKDENILRNLLAVAPKHCDNCGSKYTETNFKIVKSSPSNTVFHLKCSICGNAYMLNVINPVNGMIGAQRTPINIDLEMGEEIQKFAGKPSVDKNEAIDVYNTLPGNLTENDLNKILSEL